MVPLFGRDGMVCQIMEDASMLEPTLLVDLPLVTGEGPLWHPKEQCIYWLDIPPGLIFRYTPATGKTETFEAGAAVGGATLQADGKLLLFMADGVIRLWSDGRLTGTVIERLAEERGNRFNDVIADPKGRVFCGTMSTAERPGRLYRLDLDGTIHQLLDGIGTSNGLGFTPDRKGIYYTDTRRHAIYHFDYDAESGAITQQRTWVHVQNTAVEGRPDGLTVDAAGFVWSARWDGGCAVRYDPAGNEVDRIEFPCRKVTSMTFGGPAYRDLFITTAGGDDRNANGSHAGALFHVRPPVPGVPEFRSRIGLAGFRTLPSQSPIPAC